MERPSGWIVTPAEAHGPTVETRMLLTWTFLCGAAVLIAAWVIAFRSLPVGCRHAIAEAVNVRHSTLTSATQIVLALGHSECESRKVIRTGFLIGPGGSPQLTDDLAGDQKAFPLLPTGRDRADDPPALGFTEDVVRSDLLANLEDRRTRVPVVRASPLGT